MPDEDARVFSNDLDALDHARQLADQHSVERWECERRVARVKPGDAGPTRFDKDPN